MKNLKNFAGILLCAAFTIGGGAAFAEKAAGNMDRHGADLDSYAADLAAGKISQAEYKILVNGLNVLRDAERINYEGLKKADPQRAKYIIDEDSLRVDCLGVKRGKPKPETGNQPPASPNPSSGSSSGPSSGPVNPVGNAPGGDVTPPTDIPGTDNGGGPNGVLEGLDKLINTAEKIINVIDRNKPVVDVNVNYANAIPKGIGHWTELAGWQAPKTMVYRFSARNLFGAEMVNVKYQVNFTYGGNYNGKGKFLTGVTIQPLSINVGWGMKVTLTAEVPDSSINNVGTADDPIAAMQVILNWKIQTVLKEINNSNIYYVRGDGDAKEIGTPFKGSARVNIEKIKAVQPLLKK